MFQSLSDRLQKSFQALRGQSKLTESNIKDSLSQVRTALLEADVALEVVDDFIQQVQEKALGQEVLVSVKPADALVKVVNDELTHILGDKTAELNLKAQPPVTIMMAGLQGSGKTTSTAKLALYLKEQLNKKVMVASADVHRPAAIEQLQTLAKQIGVEFFPSHTGEKPKHIARDALKAAKKQFMDILIIDTAGRLHIDKDLMQELKDVRQAIDPKETLLVVDSMIGQDAAKMAKQFHEATPITGIILSKTDGDARGGAALSMRMVTGQPIKFVGVGEKVEALEVFHPERMASRILGMGDILSLVEEAERKVDKKKAEKMAKKFKRGQRFDLNDYLSQLEQMKKMGGLNKLMAKMPNMPAQMQNPAMKQFDDKSVKTMESLIQSMTPQERAFPAVLNGSRKQRIAAGSGRKIQDINKLLKQFLQLQKMMKRVNSKKFAKQIKGLQGNLPPGLDGGLPDDFLK